MPEYIISNQPVTLLLSHGFGLITHRPPYVPPLRNLLRSGMHFWRSFTVLTVPDDVAFDFLIHLEKDLH